MKHINLIFVALSIVLLVLTGCSDNSNLTQPEIQSEGKVLAGTPVVSVKQVYPEKPAIYPVYTEKNEKIGNVTVLYHDGFFHVTFQTGKGWNLMQTNLHMAADVKGIPVNKEGVPVIEKFSYSTMHKGEKKEHTYVIPYNDYGFKRGQEIAIAANVMLFEDKGSPEKARILKGWAGTDVGPGPEWWSYIAYLFTGGNNPGGDLRPESLPYSEAEYSQVKK